MPAPHTTSGPTVPPAVTKDCVAKVAEAGKTQLVRQPFLRRDVPCQISAAKKILAFAALRDWA